MNRNFIFTDDTELPVGTMYCIGRNFSAHAKEMGAELPESALVFIKPPTAFVPNQTAISIPSISKNMHHEVEMVVIIGKECSNITASSALEYVAGYAVGIDLTLRDVQALAKQRGEPWAIAKGFAGSAPISTAIPANKIENPNNLSIELEVNGEVRQSGSTNMMERTVEQLIEYVASIFTLREGDCIFTGTPEGVGRLESGDMVTAKLQGVPTLEISIV
ncbi:MAG: fumarylacetoacetate hydrolase family protein [Ignavibacteriae bacterium]|nr:fumarylacetoacetate hydrolase family protein [Ignavibacteriota bacterium]